MEAGNTHDENEQQEMEAHEERKQTKEKFKALIAENGMDQPLIAAAAEVSRKIVEDNIKPAGEEGDEFFRTYDADALFQSFVPVVQCTSPDFAVDFAIDKAIMAGHCVNGYDIARVRLAIYSLLLPKLLKSA
jgi:hypothetical protein